MYQLLAFFKALADETRVNDRITIAAEGLAKRFGEVQAVANVSFQVRQGKLFGFLGPNGAGKTTTINMLTGLSSVAMITSYGIRGTRR